MSVSDLLLEFRDLRSGHLGRIVAASDAPFGRQFSHDAHLSGRSGYQEVRWFPSRVDVGLDAGTCLPMVGISPFLHDDPALGVDEHPVAISVFA